MEDTNAPEPPAAHGPEGAPSSGPAGPPILPELGGASASAGSIPYEPAPPDETAPADRLAFMRNRAILGGLGVVVVLLLIAIVLATVGSGDGEPRSRSVAGVTTPDGEATASPRAGLTGQVRTTTSIRNGPGLAYAILGTVPKGALVAVIGRDDNKSWLQITYPPGSRLRGWVSIAFIDVTGDISQLAVATPGAGPSVAVPTSLSPTLPPATPLLASPTATEPSTATATPTDRSTRTPRPPPTGTPVAPPTLTPAATATPQPTPTAPPPPTEAPKE